MLLGNTHMEQQYIRRKLNEEMTEVEFNESFKRKPKVNIAIVESLLETAFPNDDDNHLIIEGFEFYNENGYIISESPASNALKSKISKLIDDVTDTFDTLDNPESELNVKRVRALLALTFGTLSLLLSTVGPVVPVIGFISLVAGVMGVTYGVIQASSYNDEVNELYEYLFQQRSKMERLMSRLDPTSPEYDQMEMLVTRIDNIQRVLEQERHEEILTTMNNQNNNR